MKEKSKYKTKFKQNGGKQNAERKEEITKKIQDSH